MVQVLEKLLSVIPVIENLEKNKSINKILITSSTHLSSSKILLDLKFKKNYSSIFSYR